ncbi:MAG TPA: hypothetical protein VII99_05705, partial [Bacteroidia bacterium]
MKNFLLLSLSISYMASFTSFSQGTWTQRANFGGTKRSRAVSFSIGTKGYIGTGVDPIYKKDFW